MPPQIENFTQNAPLTFSFRFKGELCEDWHVWGVVVKYKVCSLRKVTQFSFACSDLFLWFPA